MTSVRKMKATYPDPLFDSGYLTNWLRANGKRKGSLSVEQEKELMLALTNHLKMLAKARKKVLKMAQEDIDNHHKRRMTRLCWPEIYPKKKGTSIV